MEITLMRNAVNTLLKHYKYGTSESREIFLMYLQALCSEESEFYILNEWRLLAQVIDERNAYFLIDYIAVYDYKTAQILDCATMRN